MAAFAWGGWAMGVGLAGLLAEAKAVGREANFDHLGEDAASQRAMLASFVNRCVEDVLDKAGALGAAESSLPVAAGVQCVPLPADLRGRDVRKVVFSDGAGRAAQLDFIGRAAADGLAGWYQGETGLPRSFSLSEDGKRVLLWPTPSAGGTVAILYRSAPTEITAEQIAAPEGVMIGEIPARFQEAMALKLAALIVWPLRPDVGESLMLRYENPDPRAPGALDRLLREMNRTLATLRGGQSRKDGLVSARTLFAGLTKL